MCLYHLFLCKMIEFLKTYSQKCKIASFHFPPHPYKGGKSKMAFLKFWISLQESQNYPLILCV